MLQAPGNGDGKIGMPRIGGIGAIPVVNMRSKIVSNLRFGVDAYESFLSQGGAQLISDLQRHPIRAMNSPESYSDVPTVLRLPPPSASK